MIRRHHTPSDRYHALFAGALAELPGARDQAIRTAREASFARFMALGFPSSKAERWKYTPLTDVAREAFELAPAAAIAASDLEAYRLPAAATRLVFVNGRFAPDLSDQPIDLADAVVTPWSSALDQALGLSDADDPDRGMSALNAAFATDGAVIRLGAATALDGPVQLMFVSVGQRDPVMSHPRNQIVLAAGAKLDLVETHIVLGNGANFTNLVTTVDIGRGAILRHDRLQVGATSTTFVGKTSYRISADARPTQTLAILGGGLVRNEIEARLDGTNIDLKLNGLYHARDQQHVDNTIRVDHAEPGCVSNQFYKGILDGRAKGIFAGKILVRQDAQKTNAYQTNNNLLLSPDAEVAAKPELEIYADDVKCSHGATTGELDDHELFYLRSRGLDPMTARGLLTYAFADEVIERFTNPAVLHQAKAELVRWLPGGAALQELAQ